MQTLATAKFLDTELRAYQGAFGGRGAFDEGGAQGGDLVRPHDFVVEMATHRVNDPAFEAIWRALVAAGESVQKIYQTPEFFKASLEGHPEERMEVVSLVRRSDHAVVGVVPVRMTRHDIEFNLGPVKLFSVCVNMVTLLGSSPAIPASTAALEYLATQMLALFPSARAIYMQALPLEGRHWKDIEVFDGKRNLAACRIGP